MRSIIKMDQEPKINIVDKYVESVVNLLNAKRGAPSSVQAELNNAANLVIERIVGYTGLDRQVIAEKVVKKSK